MIHYLHLCDNQRHNEGESFQDSPDKTLQIILGGYSYGSWICSHLATPLEIWNLIETAIEGSTAADIKARALLVAMQTNEELSTARKAPRKSHDHTLSVGGEETSPEKRRRSADISPNRFSTDLRRSLDLPRKLANLRRKSRQPSGPAVEATEHATRVGPSTTPAPKIEAAYLLVSPLLPPISSFTTLPIGLRALKSHDESSMLMLSLNRTLAVFGSDDMFTSGNKLRKWAQEISAMPESRFHHVEVNGAGHFWRGHAVQKSLKIAVKEWAHALAFEPHVSC